MNIEAILSAVDKCCDPSEPVAIIAAEVRRLRDEVNGLTGSLDRAEAALKEAQAQEPVAWMHDKDGRVDTCHDSVKKLWLKVGQQQNTQFMMEVVPCRVEHYNIPLYARPVPAPDVPNDIIPEGDDFNGTTPHLIQCIESLVRLDAKGVLVPHGIGRDASKLLTAAANRLRQQAPAVTVPAVSEEWRDVLNECADDLAIELDQRYGESRKYPSEQRKYEAEMQPVYRARALLQSAPQSSTAGLQLPPGWSITRCDDNNLIVSHGEKGSVVISRKPTDLRVFPEAVLFALAEDLLGDSR